MEREQTNIDDLLPKKKKNVIVSVLIELFPVLLMAIFWLIYAFGMDILEWMINLKR